MYKDRIEIIRFTDNGKYKIFFSGSNMKPLKELSKALIKTFIITFKMTYEKGYAIAFIKDDEMNFYITPEEFLES